MKHIVLYTLIASLLILTPACGSNPLATPDTQSTIDAAVANTATAQAGIQATVDAAVAATATASAALATPTPDAALATPTLDTALATPTPSVEYVTMTEEELAALIDQAVADAAAATQASSEATTQATADDALTQEEVTTIEVQVTGAEEAIAYAEELLNAYYGLYGDLATETLYLLQAMEEDLALMAESTAALAQALVDINATLAEGVALADETITQLEATAQAAAAKAAEIQTQKDTWTAALQQEWEHRASQALSVPPNAIAEDRARAVQSAFDYLDTVRDALSDNKLSPNELSQIAQLGANASAGLNAQGGPQLQKLSGNINQITEQLARGQVTHAKEGLGTLESALGSRPSLPSRPSRP